MRAVKLTNVKHKLNNRKTMGLVAFTSKPKRFLVSFLPRGTTKDAEYMIQYIKDTGKRFQNLERNSIALKDTTSKSTMIDDTLLSLQRIF